MSKKDFIASTEGEARLTHQVGWWIRVAESVPHLTWLGVILVAILCLSAPRQAHARQQVSSGVELFVDSERVEWPVDVPMPGQNAQWQRLLEDWFHNQGFFEAKIADTEALDAALRISDRVIKAVHINRGSETLLTEVVLQGDEYPKLSDSATPVIGERASANTIEALIGSLLGVLTTDGYLGATISVSDAKWESGELTLFLDLQIRAQYRLDGVRLQGDERTKQSLLLDFLGLEVGQSVAGLDRDDLRTILLGAGLHRQVGAPVYELLDDSLAVLLFPVQARPPGQFDLVAGYLPSTGGQSGRVIGSGHILLDNAFGAGRLLSATIQRLPQQTSSFRLDVEDPLFVGLPVRVGFGMEGLQQDSTYNRTGIRLSALLRLDRWSEIGGRFSREVTRPGQAGAQFDNGRQRVGRNTGTWAGVELRINRLDNRIAPRKGLSLWTTLERGYRDSERRKIADGDTVRISQRDSQERLEVGLRVHGLNRGRFGGLVGVDAHLIRSEDLDESDLFFMGGASSLRGYDENRFRGSTLVRAFAEPRYHLDDGSMVFLFVDMGYVESSLTKDSKGSWYPGYGIGFVFSSGIGPISISYALNNEGGWREGRVHVAVSFGL